MCVLVQDSSKLHTCISGDRYVVKHECCRALARHKVEPRVPLKSSSLTYRRKRSECAVRCALAAAMKDVVGSWTTAYPTMQSGLPSDDPATSPEKTCVAVQITVQGEHGKAGHLTSDAFQPLDKRKPSLEEVDLDDPAAEPAEIDSDTGKLVQASLPWYTQAGPSTRIHVYQPCCSCIVAILGELPGCHCQDVGWAQDLKMVQSSSYSAVLRTAYTAAQAEERAKGRVATDVYRVYITSWGPWLMVPAAVVVFFICERSLTVRPRHTD